MAPPVAAAVFSETRSGGHHVRRGRPSISRRLGNAERVCPMGPPLNLRLCARSLGSPHRPLGRCRPFGGPAGRPSWKTRISPLNLRLGSVGETVEETVGSADCENPHTTRGIISFAAFFKQKGRQQKKVPWLYCLRKGGMHLMEVIMQIIIPSINCIPPERRQYNQV